MGKHLNHQDIPIVYKVLSGIADNQSFNLILNLSGGKIDEHERLIGCIRWFECDYDVYICDQALSAGGLVALSGSQMFMHPNSVISPLDPILSSSETHPLLPNEISSEDIRSYISITEDWYGLNTKEDKIQFLQSISAKLSPFTLSKFYRAERYMIKTLSNLLTKHVNNHTDIHNIAIDLVRRFPSHYHKICFDTLKDMGINVLQMNSEIICAAHNITESSKKYCEDHKDFIVNALIFTSSSFFEHRISAKEYSEVGYQKEPEITKQAQTKWFSKWVEVK